MPAVAETRLRWRQGPAGRNDARRRPDTRAAAPGGPGRCRAATICVHDQERGQRLGGRRCVTARPLAQGNWPQNFCCVTTRRRNFEIFGRLRRSGAPPTACLLRFGVPGFDGLVLTATGLSLCRFPASNQPAALRVLAVTLVPTLRRVGVSAALAQAPPRSRSPTTTAV